MSEIQTVNAHNVRDQFRIGTITYAHGALGSSDFMLEAAKRSHFIVLMAPENFLSVVSPTFFPSVNYLTDALNDNTAIDLPYLEADFRNSRDTLITITSHEGRNRSKTSSRRQPNMPVPVLINTKKLVTVDEFSKFSAGALNQSSFERIEKPLFRCFFHAGKRYGVVRTPNDNGGVDYSAEEAPYSRDIGAPF